MAFCKLNNLLTVFGKRLICGGRGREGICPRISGADGAGLVEAHLDGGGGAGVVSASPRGPGCADGRRGAEQRRLGPGEASCGSSRPVRGVRE